MSIYFGFIFITTISTNFVLTITPACLFHEQKDNNKTSFIDGEITWETIKYVTSVDRKITFSTNYTHFRRFFSTIYEFGMVYVLANRWLLICLE